MELNELKVKLGEAGVAYAGKSDEDIIRLGLTNSIIAADDELAKSLGSKAKKVGNTFEDFKKAREEQGVGAKIDTREGKGGNNPFLVDESNVVCVVIGESEERLSANKKTYYRTRLQHPQHGSVYVNTNGPLTQGDYYSVRCRILGEGTYMDADKFGVQRELVVPEGRTFIYNPAFGPLRVTLEGLKIQQALKGNLAGF